MENKIIFRVDSSFQIATGHVMRCLTLAKILQEKGGSVIFICRDLRGNIIERIKEEGFKVEILSKPNKKLEYNDLDDYLKWLEVDLIQDAIETKNILQKSGKNNILIIDHYAIDYSWEDEVKNYTNKIIIIDDLANRKHNCDILIDHNLYQNYQNRYDNLVSKDCQKLLGPDYAILRKEFYELQPRIRTEVKNILIFFGGIDNDNLTLRAINSIIRLESNFNVKVIGAKNHHQEFIKNICQKNNFEYIAYSDKMAQIMNWADISIGAGGTTSWERCCLKLPAIVISAADNQIEICNILHKNKVIKYIGRGDCVKESDILSVLYNVMKNFDFNYLEVGTKLNDLINNIAS